MFAYNIVYVYTDTLEIILPITNYTEPFRSKLRKNCENTTECVLRAMFQKDIMIAIGSNFPYYLAFEYGVHDASKAVCFLHETIITVPNSVGMHKGNPLLDILDKHIRMCIEGGFTEKFWSQLKHTYQLQAVSSYDENEMYFVFSLNHLEPVFLLLICSYVICIIIFIFELGINKWMKMFSIFKERKKLRKS